MRKLRVKDVLLNAIERRSRGRTEVITRDKLSSCAEEGFWVCFLLPPPFFLPPPPPPLSPPPPFPLPFPPPPISFFFHAPVLGFFFFSLPPHAPTRLHASLERVSVAKRPSLLPDNCSCSSLAKRRCSIRSPRRGPTAQTARTNSRARPRLHRTMSPRVDTTRPGMLPGTCEAIGADHPVGALNGSV